MIIGIDPSIRSTGICILSENSIYWHGFSSVKKWVGETEHYTIHPLIEKNKSKANSYYDYRRAKQVQAVLFDIISNDADVQIGIEGYSYASHGKTFNIGEFVGSIKHSLYDMGIHFIEVPPTVVKKCATGSGGASKLLMELALKKQYKLYYDMIAALPDNIRFDLIDSFWISQYVKNFSRNVKDFTN